MFKSSERDRERARLWYQNNKERARENRKKLYWSNPDKYRADTKAYWDERRSEKREKDKVYKDKVRHAGKRLDLITKNGLRCSVCGEVEESKNIVAHHLLEKSNHELQILLCRACHARVHIDNLNQRGESENEADSPNSGQAEGSIPPASS
jgi:uncharacterized protein YlaI